MIENREYHILTSAAFCKTKESFGGLSNMAAGYPVIVNGVSVRTSEAIYQACRFPDFPDIQKAIIDEKSPMTTKKYKNEYPGKVREDWQNVSISVMRWAIRKKLSDNMETFGSLLLSTGDLPIVEISYKDPFWGATPKGQKLVGKNVLGRLLMELRKEYMENDIGYFNHIENPKINNFLFLGEKIEPYRKREEKLYNCGYSG